MTSNDNAAQIPASCNDCGRACDGELCAACADRNAKIDAFCADAPAMAESFKGPSAAIARINAGNKKMIPLALVKMGAQADLFAALEAEMNAAETATALADVQVKCNAARREGKLNAGQFEKLIALAMTVARAIVIADARPTVPVAPSTQAPTKAKKAPRRRVYTVTLPSGDKALRSTETKHYSHAIIGVSRQSQTWAAWGFSESAQAAGRTVGSACRAGWSNVRVVEVDKA